MSSREVRAAPLRGDRAEIQDAGLLPAQRLERPLAASNEFADRPVREHDHQDGAVDPIGEQPSAACILIVDDDVSSIHVLRHTLTGMGNLHFAKSGEEALQLAQRLVPDLILLDAHMPGLDGFEVCHLLKSNEAFKHVPIAFITRFSDPASETRALGLGAADFIAKPYTSAVLQARARNLLDLKRRTDAELRALRDHWKRVGDARVADIVDAASDAIVTYDAENKVVLINASACRMFDVAVGQAIGSDARLLLGEGVLATGRLCNPVRATLSRADKTSLSIEISASRIGDGSERLTTVMLRDIGDRELLEAESRSRLEAEAASRTKTLMMSYIAHEIGNPLNGLLGFAELMADDDAGVPLPPDQAKRLGLIVECGRSLQALMRDVTDIGRFETGNLAVEMCSFDGARCIRDASAAVSALARQAGVTLTSSASAQLHLTADVNRLHQCLVNLLSNGIKYNHRGGWIRISIEGDAKEVRITVRDGGLGMNSLQLRHLFEPFNRLGRRSSVAPGVGLGLVITRQLVEAMNGRLEVESEPGTGSCFAIVLPNSPIVIPSTGHEAHLERGIHIQ